MSSQIPPEASMLIVAQPMIKASVPTTSRRQVAAPRFARGSSQLHNVAAAVPAATGALFAASALLSWAGVSSLRKRRHGAQRRQPKSLVTVAAEPEKPSAPPQVPPVRMPMISTASGNIDVMSQLLKDRILILSGQVNDEMANVLIAQMLYLANQDSEKDITIYINSPGGSVSAGLAIYDSMQFVPCNVNTVCFGMAASMGAFLLGAGTKGKRKSLPNSRVMIHQPLGGAGGQAADIEIQAKEILFLREVLNTYLCDFTGKSMEQMAKDCDRDYFMTPEEAVEYGIIDEVVETRSWPRLKKPPKPEMLADQAAAFSDEAAAAST
eukprot:CAMPEP_0172697034 /NCGR_PEP_ID=MMETSP1074-20121228/28470_1 /TAXON_ID=2916 /ORGANISM="Ceratium fusus, Strain PA161109" /LENGTH=323 /DNA_ID=CAMNT_0013517867 /DNA_START=84 /DNA_END=1055 /DNA_ORIENTATION=+